MLTAKLILPYKSLYDCNGSNLVLKILRVLICAGTSLFKSSKETEIIYKHKIFKILNIFHHMLIAYTSYDVSAIVIYSNSNDIVSSHRILIIIDASFVIESRLPMI